MAKILTDSGYMALPINIKRGNPIPLDTTAVWYNKTELENYAATGATAYVGQILTLVADSKCEAFMISNEAGTLIKLAQTTASGDLAHDVATLQGQVADLISKVGAKAGADTEATGLYKEIADVLAVANGKVSSVKATDASVVIGGTATEPTVSVAISADEGNALSLAADGLKVTIPEVTIPEYSLKKLDAATAGMSASYQLTKDGTGIGAVIDIPKDMMVKSGSVQTYEAGSLPAGVTEAGTYIVLVLNDTAETKLYINVGNLIEYVTSGSAEGDMVFINIDPQTHKVTATITDGTVTEAKLHADVKAKLAKAMSAVQEIESGTANGTIAVDGTNVAVHGLQDAAYTTVASLNETAQSKVDTAKGELIGSNGDEADASTIAGAKKYADSVSATAQSEAIASAQAKIEELDVTDEAVAKKFVSAVSETDGKITVSRRELIADDVPNLGISKIDGLQAALDAKQDELVFNTAYDSSTNKVATMTDVGNAKDALVGTDSDTKASNTIKGAKLYTDDKASSALNDAKAYADSLVTGDSGITKRVQALETKVDTGKVSEAIATAKNEAITAAGTNADTKISTAKTEILGEAGYQQTVKSAYELAGTKATLDEAVAEIEKKDYATKAQAQGYADAKDEAIANAKKAGTDAQSAVNALSDKVGSIPEGSSATTVVGYVNEKVGAIPAQTNYSVTVTPSTVEGLAKRYTIHQQATGLDVNIDIPTDMVVKSGEVATNPVGQPAGTYLVLTLANSTNDKVYIDVGNLIEYVTSGSGADDMVKIAVSADHKVTASITDGSITKAKLATAVQDSLNKADSAIQPAGLTSALAPYAKTADVARDYVAKETGKRLMTDAEGTKLEGIAAGAQVNKIESVKVGGTALEITEKAVNISQISTDLLVNGTETLILDCGNANP